MPGAATIMPVGEAITLQAVGTEPVVAFTITIVPGQRYAFGEITLAGAEGDAQVIAREALELDSGDPIVAAQVEAAEANVLLRLPQNGYPFATVGIEGSDQPPRDILLDPDTGRGDYTLQVVPGPRARFRRILTEGDAAFETDHIDLLARFEEGQLFDRRMMDDLREAMVATRLFSTVAAE